MLWKHSWPGTLWRYAGIGRAAAAGCAEGMPLLDCAYARQADLHTDRLRHRAQAQQEREAATRLAMQRAAEEYAEEAAKLAEEAHRAEERSAAKAAAEERSAARAATKKPSAKAATKKSSAKARAARRAETTQARHALQNPETLELFHTLLVPPLASCL